MKALGAFNAARLIHLSYFSILFNLFFTFIVYHGVIWALYRRVDIMYALATFTTVLGSTLEYLFSLEVGVIAF